MPKDIKINNLTITERDVARVPGAMDSICRFCNINNCKLSNTDPPIMKCRKFLRFPHGVTS